MQRAADFYTKHFGFKLEHQQLPMFAVVSLGDFDLLLSGPGASGSRPMADGRKQEPGGWNEDGQIRGTEDEKQERWLSRGPAIGRRSASSSRREQS